MHFKQFPSIDFRFFFCLSQTKIINTMYRTFHKEHVLLNSIGKKFVAVQAYLLKLECGKPDKRTELNYIHCAHFSSML